MIDVRTQVRSIDTADGRRLWEAFVSAHGHAGYEIEGKDIICASVSTCMECIENMLEHHFPSVESNGESGNVEVSVMCPSVLSAHTALDLIDPILQVIEDLSREYPDNVSVYRFT